MSDVDPLSSSRVCRACSDFKSWMTTQKTKTTVNTPQPKVSQAPNSSDQTKQKDQEESRSTEKEKDKSEDPSDDPIDLAVADHAAGVCPPDRSELGSSSWTLLHSVAAYFPEKPTEQQQNDARQLMEIFGRLYPCSDCAEDLRGELAVNPPVTSSGVLFSDWLCRLHNRVSVKLGKPEFDCSKVMQRWRDGWKDGSCD